MGLINLFCVLCLIAIINGQENSSVITTENDLTSSDADHLSFSSPSNDMNDTSTTNQDIIITREVTSDYDVTDDNTTDTETTLQPNENVTTIEKDSNWTACVYQPCKNDGICDQDPVNEFLYRCKCKNDFIGKLCGVKDYCFANENGAICNRGVCVYSTDGSSRECKCFSGTYWDEIRKECRESEPPCFPNPCLNDGACKSTNDGDYECHCPYGFVGKLCEDQNKCGENNQCKNGKCVEHEDGHKKFCVCDSHYYWNENKRSCEEIKSPCEPNPCHNNGSCEILPENKYNCTCLGHYADEDCNIPDLCYSADNDLVCGGHGDCQNFTRCICEEDYFYDENDHTCRENKKPCFPNPCHNDGLCLPLDSENYNCTCSEGYTGLTCAEQNFCVLLSGNSRCGEGYCKNNMEQMNFYCSCDEGFYFDYSTKKCEKVNLCPLIKCDVNEECRSNNCTCQPNYKRNNVTDKCEANFCDSNPCQNDMLCKEGKNGKKYQCYCEKGFSFNGNHCIESVCEFPKFNDCEQNCEETEGGYKCLCQDQYSLKADNKTCNYEGNMTCSNKTCNKGTCWKHDEEEICLCKPGFVEMDGNCIDKCAADKLEKGLCPDNQCESTRNGFRCNCTGKYILSPDGATCIKRNVCDRNEIGWKACAAKNAKCDENWNKDVGYDCLCVFPQVMSNKGICQDPCGDDSIQRKCSSLGADCDLNSEGQAVCTCPPLYAQPKNGEPCSKLNDFSYTLTLPLDVNSYKTKQLIDTIGRDLEPDVTADYFRIKVDIEKALKKIYPEILYMNVLNCKADLHYFLCKIELQSDSELEQKYLDRIKTPGLCVAEKNSSDICLIPPSLVLTKDLITVVVTVGEIQPCDEDIKRIICGAETSCVAYEHKTQGKLTEKYFNCECLPGFIARRKMFPFSNSQTYIEVCEDIDECSFSTNPCPQNTKCENTIGGYSCSCIEGYRIKNRPSKPEVDGCVEICNPNPCVQGTCEKKWENDFECRCEAGFTGELCDLTDENFKRVHNNVIIVGVVLGGVLLVTIIIFVVTVSRLKKRKYHENDRMLSGTEMGRRDGGAINNSYQ